jgi:3-phosphoshikimate 1-carboxyvinyltransferase
MMQLSCKNKNLNGVIELTASKSESNRVLIIRALTEGNLEIQNLSDAEDTKVLEKALADYPSCKEINVGHAGTSYRFLTAFLATREKGNWILTGSERMKERPISILVEALRSLEANIQHLEKEGFPPLKIEASPQLKNEVAIAGNVSSQYISALLLIAPTLKNGLIIKIEGTTTSLPYIKMTTALMHYFGIQISWDEIQNIISIAPQNYQPKKYEIEADWSAASYWFGIIALSEIGSCLHLKGLRKDSLQGDAALTTIYKSFGVSATFENGNLIITKISNHNLDSIHLNLKNTPDIAQTILCTCAGLNIEAKIDGLHTLKIKETDRVSAMKSELSKFGVQLDILSDDAVFLRQHNGLQTPQSPIETYQDHRMAMAFATLSIKCNLQIANPDVVKKSYPNFWKDLENIGIEIIH